MKKTVFPDLLVAQSSTIASKRGNPYYWCFMSRKMHIAGDFPPGKIPLRIVAFTSAVLGLGKRLAPDEKPE